jgi:hypothetical protein
VGGVHTIAIENLEWQKMADLTELVDMSHSRLWRNRLNPTEINDIPLKKMNIYKVVLACLWT